MFITPAYAQVASSGAEGLPISLIVLFLIFAIMYFLVLRPQRVQMKKHQELVKSVRRGDTVITAGGIVGKVVKVHDELGEIDVEIAKDVEVRVIRSTLSNVRVKGESKPTHHDK